MDGISGIRQRACLQSVLLLTAKAESATSFLLSVVQNCMGSIAIRLKISALSERLECLTIVNCKICLQLDLVAASLGFVDSRWLRCSDAAHQDMSDVCSRRGRD